VEPLAAVFPVPYNDIFFLNHSKRSAPFSDITPQTVSTRNLANKVRL